MATRSLWKSRTVCQSAGHNVPKDLNLQPHRCLEVESPRTKEVHVDFPQELYYCATAAMTVLLRNSLIINCLTLGRMLMSHAASLQGAAGGEGCSSGTVAGLTTPYHLQRSLSVKWYTAQVSQYSDQATNTINEEMWFYNRQRRRPASTPVLGTSASIPGDRAAGGVQVTTQRHLVLRRRMCVWSYTSTPYTFIACKRWNFYLTL